MMKDWFLQLAPRERILIIAAAALAVFALVMTLGIGPLLSNTATATQQVDDKQQLLVELDQLAARLGPGGGAQGNRTSVSSNQSLVVLIDRTTRAVQLGNYIKRNQPDGNDRIRLRFENAPFDTLIVWLNQMQGQYGLMSLADAVDYTRFMVRFTCDFQRFAVMVPDCGSPIISATLTPDGYEEKILS